MSIGQFINDYFITPIIAHQGYNPVNTIAYALIAVVVVYIVYKLFKNAGIAFDRHFIARVIPYVLLGSTIRVVTDSIDTGVMQKYNGAFNGIYNAILNSHIYDYGFLTASPGIYIIVGIFAIATLYYSYKSRNYDVGSKLAYALFALHLIILAPMFANIAYAIPILLIAGGIGYAYNLIKKKSNVAMHSTIVFAQALDGAATFVTLDIFNRLNGNTYVEQHVFANAIANAFSGSMLPFLIIKIVLAMAIVWILEKEENESERNFIALLIIIFGLAPGVRDLLRLTVGA